jgi:ABC-2 type transport system ATP-binding protein
VLSEVERICDRIALLRKGHLVLLADLHTIRNLAPRRVQLTFSSDVNPPANLPTGHQAIEVTPRAWCLDVIGPLGPLLASISGLPLEDLQLRGARMEDVVLKHYRGGDS